MHGLLNCICGYGCLNIPKNGTQLVQLIDFVLLFVIFVPLLVDLLSQSRDLIPVLAIFVSLLFYFVLLLVYSCV